MRKTDFDAFTLKMIAIAGMILQHIAIVLRDVVVSWLHFPLQFAGGFTFPIMAFFLVEGYKHTSNIKKYVGRMLIFGLISQIPFIWTFGPQLNIMFTLLFGLFTLILYDKMKNRGLFWFIFVIYVILSTVIVNWGLVGPIVILLYHTIKSEKARRTVPALVAGGLNFLLLIVIAVVVAIIVIVIDNPEILEKLSGLIGGEDVDPIAGLAAFLFPFGSIAAIPLIRGYNGERGRNMKFLFYAFYPLHLLILALIAFALGISELSLFGFEI